MPQQVPSSCRSCCRPQRSYCIRLLTDILPRLARGRLWNKYFESSYGTMSWHSDGRDVGTERCRRGQSHIEKQNSIAQHPPLRLRLHPLDIKPTCQKSQRAEMTSRFQASAATHFQDFKHGFARTYAQHGACTGTAFRPVYSAI